MREHGVLMWLVVNREYAEDPVYFSLASPSTMAARRRTILVFSDRGEAKGVERFVLGGGRYGGLYEVYRDPALEAPELWGQWALLRRFLTVYPADLVGFTPPINSDSPQALRHLVLHFLCCVVRWRTLSGPVLALVIRRRKLPVAVTGVVVKMGVFTWYRLKD